MHRGAASYGRTKIRKTKTVTKKQGEIAKKRGANGEKRGAFSAPLRRWAEALRTSVFWLPLGSRRRPISPCEEPTVARRRGISDAKELYKRKVHPAVLT
jgi:hypothetical protein